MDIYRFMNSKDVAGHLNSVGYPFDAMEAAYFVTLSKHAILEDKDWAWRWVANNMPDCDVTVGPLFHARDTSSIHELLLSYADLQLGKIERFYEEEGCFFQIDFDYEDRNGMRRSWDCAGGSFNSLRDCQDYINALPDPFISKEITGRDKIIERYRIRKHRIDASAGHFDEMLVDENFDPLSVSLKDLSCSDRQLDSLFDRMWLDVPLPFRRGDVVINATEYEETPFVLFHLSTWPHNPYHAVATWAHEELAGSACARCEQSPRCLSAHAGISRMESYGIAVEGQPGIRNMGSNPLDLEYFRGDLIELGPIGDVLTAYRDGLIGIGDAMALVEYLDLSRAAGGLRWWFDEDCTSIPGELWQRVR